ncbi:fungal-specific transcription factor domain-containing protein [Aspergillus varians]
MPRPRTACFNCASIKTACSQGQPCHRCERLDLACSYSLKYHRTWTADDAGSGRSRWRVRHHRSRNGCGNCLRRRKKCDEEFPRCRECCRLGLGDCHQRRGSSSSSNNSVDKRHQAQGLSYGTAASTVSSNAWLHHGGGSSSDDLALNVNEYLGYVALMPEGHLAGITRRGHLNESSALQSRQTAQSDDQAQKQLLSEVVLPLGGMLSLEDLDPTEHHLLLHFIQHVARALVVVNDRENPFLNEILPMALEVKAVRHAMFALAACHLCKVYPKFEDTLIRQHGLALHHLKLDLQSKQETRYVLVTSLLLSLFAICQGNSQKWILHLYGAKALIDSQLEEGSPKPSSKFILDLYDFICCKTRITCDKVPIPRGRLPLLSTYSEQQPSSSSTNNNKIHPLFGLAGDIYQLLNSISQLALDKKALDISTPNSTLFTHTQARRIERHLEQWTAPTKPNRSQKIDQLLRDSTMAANAIRWAALIRLYQVMGDDDDQHSPTTMAMSTKHQVAVENILASISQIQPGSPVDGQLLFPLFMAGLSATRKTERLQLEYRLSLLESSIGMGNIAGAHQLVDMVWERSRGGVSVDWEVLLEAEHPYVLLY